MSNDLVQEMIEQWSDERPDLETESGELSTGAMTNRIDKLERRGLVKRVADKSDRRAVIVRLTRRGLGQIEKAIDVRMQAASDSLGALSKSEIHNLSLSLGKLQN